MPRHYDVICSGCGPAGNLTSFLLARRGLAVLLIEREELPRAKVCGGGLTSRALALLPFDISAIVHNRIRGAAIAFGNHGAVRLDCDGVGAMVERSEFDAFMTAKAVEAGVTVLPSTAFLTVRQSADGVNVTTTRGAFSAKLLIGADGARSTVRALLFPTYEPEFAFGVEAKYFVGAGATLPEASRTQVLFDFGCVRDGYGWMFPKRDHFNVGIYRLRKTPADTSLRQALASFVRRCPALDDCTAEAALGHPIAVSIRRQPVAVGQTILVGDAAGLSEAFFGEGIAFALKSGVLAAEWVCGWLANGRGDAARSYQRALEPLIAELRYSHAIARARYRVPARWMARAAATPAIRNATVALLNGETSYRRSYWQMPLLLPRALWQRSALAADASPFELMPAGQ